LHVGEPPHRDSFTCRALSQHGTIFAASSGRAIEVRLVESNELLWTQRSELLDELIPHMVISPDDKYLALFGMTELSLRSGSDLPVDIFDLQSGQLYARFQYTSSALCVSFRSDNRQVAIGDRSGHVTLWDLDRHARMWKPRELEEWIDTVAVSPQNDLVVCSGYAHDAFTLLDATSGRVIQQCPDGQDTMRNVAWSADGKRLLISYDNRIVHLWDVASARTTNQLHLLLQIDASLSAMPLSFADGHRCITTDHGIFPIPLQYRPPCATDDHAPLSLETMLRLRKDGWVWLVGGGKGERRVCWLPPAYRPTFPTFNVSIATLWDSIRLVTDSGRPVVLDLKKWFEYENIRC